MKDKEILLTIGRYSSDTKSSLGFLLFKGVYMCDTLEDAARVAKIMHKTRLRAGVWRLKIRKELTNLTVKYRKKYPWFKFHIEIISPEFTSTYMHNGLDADWTSGCPLVGEREGVNTYKKGQLKKSKMDEVFEDFYKKVYPIIEKGENDYFINILDLDLPKSIK